MERTRLKLLKWQCKTGLYENISHSGEDSSKTVEMAMQNRIVREHIPQWTRLKLLKWQCKTGLYENRSHSGEDSSKTVEMAMQNRIVREHIPQWTRLKLLKWQCKIGLYENISHRGEDSSKTVEMAMQNMAVLTGISRDKFFSTIDFWINDRAGDNLTMLDEFGVQSEKRLFCNAHVLLTIDEGIDSAFRITESKTGKAKLISQDAGHVFTSPNNSIFIWA